MENVTDLLSLGSKEMVSVGDSLATVVVCFALKVALGVAISVADSVSTLLADRPDFDSLRLVNDSEKFVSL